MLRIYDVSLDVIGELRPVIARIERHDRDLARLRESQACCDAAIRAGYLDAITESLRAKMREVIGTLVNNIRR